MKRWLPAAVFLFLICSSALAQPKSLPGFTLPDPDGGMHSSKALLKRGMVLVVTAPTLHDQGAQEGWDKWLVDTMPKGGMLVFIEDMSVSDWKETARKEMKKDWKAGVPPLLLLDESGSVRQSLGIARDATSVLVYGKDGTLLYTENGAPGEASAKAIWSELKQ